MTLFETAQTVKRWINSCDKADQLDLCAEVTQEFVTNRFAPTTNNFDLFLSVSELSNLIEERRIIIAGTPTMQKL